MKQSTASKTLLAIVTILTVMMALIVPSPAYAAHENPPPKPPPPSDTGGGQGKPSHSSAKDLPADTTVVVTDNGTPVSLASQLTVDALSGPTSADDNPSPVAGKHVRFCTSANRDYNAGVCTDYATIEDAITDVKTMSEQSGTFYVDYLYPAAVAPLFHKTIVVGDFTDPTVDVSLQGGVNMTGGSHSGWGPTDLVQPMIIQNINADSSLYLDLFRFNITGYLSSALDPAKPDSVLAVVNSNNVTLKDITITESDKGNGIKLDTSNTVTMDNVNVNESKNGAGILVKKSTDVSLKNSTITESSDSAFNSTTGGILVTGTNGLTLDTVNVTSGGKSFLGAAANGDALNIQTSSDISMTDVVTNAYRYGAYLKNNTGTLSIDPSNFSNSGYAGLYVTGQDGKIVLDDVTADNNGTIVPDLALNPMKFLYPDTASGAAFVNDTGALIIKDSEFNGNATAGLWVQNQMGGVSVQDASATGGGSDGFVLVKDSNANGNGVSPYTHSVPIVGTLFDSLGWSGGSFIDSDSGDVVIKDSNFGKNIGTGLEVYATGGDLILKDVTANLNSGKGATLNTLFEEDVDISNILNPKISSETGSGKIIVAGDSLDNTEQITDGSTFSSQFNDNGGPGLLAFAGGFAGVFNTEVDDNLNKTNNFLVDIVLGLGGVPPLESLLLNPGGAFVYSASPDTVVVGNSDFLGNNGEGLAVMTPGDIRVHDVNGSFNDGMGAFLDNCLLQLSIQCSGQGTISVENSEFDVNSYAGLVALASGAEVSPEDVGNSFDQGIYLDQVGASGNQNYGGLLVSPADVEVTNSTFNGKVAVSDIVVPISPYQQGVGLEVLSSGNILLGSYEDLFKPDSLSFPVEDFGVLAEGNKNAGGEILGLGSLGGLGGGSLFSNLASDGSSTNGLALIGHSKFVENGGDGLTVFATKGIGVSDSIFAGNGGNGLTALSLGDITLDDSGFFRNKGTGASAISVGGDIGVDPSIFAGNGGNGLTALSLVGDIYLVDSGFYRNGGDGASAISVLGGVLAGGSEFKRNDGNGLTALSLGDILLVDSDFNHNDGSGASVASLMGVGVFGSDFFCNEENGLSAIAAGPILVGGSAFIGNEGNGASLDSVLGVAVVGSGFAFNGENGLNALAGGDIFLAGVFAGANEDNGAVLASLLGDVSVFSGVFGNPYGESALASNESETSLGNGENGLVATTLVGDITLGRSEAAAADTHYGEVDANMNGANGIVAATLFGDINAQNVYAEKNNWFGAIAVAGGDLNIADSRFNGNTVGLLGVSLFDDITVENTDASYNSLLGAALLGMGDVEIGNSTFDVNGTVFEPAPFATAANPEGFSFGGGLVAFAGGDTTLDKVEASYNHGFGAVVGNYGGLLDLLFSAGSSATGNSIAATGLQGTSLFGSQGDVSINDSKFNQNDTFGLVVASDGNVTLDDVQANHNGWFGAYISFGDEANISDSHFNDNGGTGLMVDFNPGPGFFSAGLDENTGSITLDDVTANDNSKDGAVLNGTHITISDSKFNSNDHDGLVIDDTFGATVSIYDSQACWNKHKQFVGNGATINHFDLDTECKEAVSGGGGGPTEQIPLPWQIIKVFMDPGKNGGTLSCQFGTTFLYLEKKTPPTPDFEWARAVLNPCIVPGGSIGTFLGLAEGALPIPLPDGITFQGKAFDLSITGPDGQPIDVLGGPMMVRFTLPDGFTLPAGKKLDILWFDPSTKKWVELTTYVGGKYAWGYAANDGTFVLTIK